MDNMMTRRMPVLIVVFAVILPALCSLLSCGQRPPSESLTATWRQSIKTDAFQETTGVAISNSVLFVSDSKQATIYLLNDDGSAKSELVALRRKPLASGSRSGRISGPAARPRRRPMSRCS